MTNSRAFLKRHMVIGGLLAILAASGCGAEAEPDDASGSGSDPATADSPTPDASSPALPSPNTAASEEPEADEADYESCGDGACEVSFTDSVAFPLEGSDGEWTVEAAIEEYGVQVSLTDPDGMGGGGGLLYEPGCTLAIHADGGGSLSCAEAGEAPPEPDAGGYVVHLLELNGDTAVVEAILG